MSEIPKVLGGLWVTVKLTSQGVLGRVVLSTAGRNHLLVSHMPSVHCLSSLSKVTLFLLFCELRLSSGENAGGML